MLIRFSVENFLSFDKQQEFSMIPGNIKGRDEHFIRNKSIKILKLAAIYGANASGKSNLIKAINFAKKVIVREIPFESIQMFCKINEDNERKPSKFEFEFSKDGKFYAYGFTILLKERKILSEWLYEINTKDQSPVFERETEIGRLEFYIKTSDEDEMRLNTYRLDFKDNTDRLFLNEIKTKSFSKESRLSVFTNVYNWFEDDLIIVYPEQPMIRFEGFYGKNNIERINKIIKLFDTGISKIKIEKITYKKLSNELTSEEIEKFQNYYKDALSNIQKLINDLKSLKSKYSDDINNRISEIQENTEVGISLRTKDSFYNMSGKIGEEPEITTIRTEHHKSFFDYGFKEESDGTRRLFDLLDILLSTETTEKLNRVYIIDELERSLHPKLTYRFIELFIKILEKKNVQLILTTHEPTIMDQDLLRRDEIWFVERNKFNYSRIYSLDRFQERYDKKLNKAYLEGRYGAIPIFKEFSFEEDLV